MTKQRRAQILKNIKKRDAAIKNNQKPVKRIGTKKERRFVRFGALSDETRQKNLGAIKKTAQGVKVKIGGPIRGRMRFFTRRSSARRAVNNHHDKFLVSRLGPRLAIRAKTTFKN